MSIDPEKHFQQKLGWIVEMAAEDGVLSGGCVGYIQEYCRAWREAKKTCESPIELILVTELLNGCAECGVWRWDGMPQAPNTKDQFRQFRGIVFGFQKKFQNYRSDFIVTCIHYGLQKTFAIECDGHQFHERTPTQARRDRSRDRDFLLSGIPVLRFTGSEICRSPDGCRREIQAMARKLLAKLAEESRKPKQETLEPKG